MITLLKTYVKGKALTALLSAGFICLFLALSTLGQPDTQSTSAHRPEHLNSDDYASIMAVSADEADLGEDVLAGVRYTHQSVPVATTEPPVQPIPMPKATVFGMGAGTAGQLGNGTVVDSSAPTQIGPTDQWGSLIDVGLQHALITDSSGNLWATGQDTSGAFGDGVGDSSMTQFTELSILGIKSLAAGDNHSLIIFDWGQVAGSGAGALGQLGNGGTNTNVFDNIMINGKTVEAYGNTSFVITTSGELWGFGENLNGQLGTGDTGNRLNPVMVDPAGVVDVSTSATHTLYLMDDGAVFAMGNNDFGQFGNGTTVSSFTPIQVLPAGVKQIAAGNGFSLFRMDDDVLQGAGDNSFGQLGTGDKVTQTSLFVVANNVVDMDAGIGHSVFVKNDLSLWGIGKNTNGQLGLDDFIDRLTPAQVTTTGQVTGVKASYDTTFYQQRTLNSLSITGLWDVIEGDKVNLECEAQWSDGVVTNVTAEATWSDDAPFASIMQNSGVLHADPSTSGSSINITASYLGIQTGYTVNVKSPATGAAMFGHGANTAGQLGLGTTTDQLSEALIDSNKVVSIAAGVDHSVYVREDGSVWAMGDNTYGQLGTGDNAQRKSPIQIISGGAAEVAAGDFHSLIVMRDGSLWAMGRNTEGQLGDGTFNNRNFPTKIVNSGIRRAVGGGFHSAFTSASGSLWTMGRGVEGQLGTGDGAGRNYPYMVVSTNIDNAYAGKNHTIYTDQSGALWGMGDNSNGQLGIGPTPTTQFSPVMLVASGVNELTAAGNNSYYISIDGNLFFAGNNDFGQLGNGNPGVNVDTFTQLAGYNNIDVVAGGVDFTIFIDQTGQMRGMGNYANGQLGQGTTGSTSVPITLPHTNVTNGGFGSKHILYTKAQPTNIRISGLNDVYENEEAQYKCFLEYDNGALEDITGITTWTVNNANTTINAAGRLFIDAGTGGQQVTVSANYNALSDNLVANIAVFAPGFGDLRGLGANDSYQLGDNLNPTAHLTPVAVDTDVVSVASGTYHTMYVKKDGSLWATGDNASGQLGTGDFNPRQSPVMVLAADVVDVDCGMNYSMFVKNDGSLWAMGDMTDGKLGNDLFAGQLSTPVMIKEAGVIDVKCGFNHTLFLCSDGSLWGMGRNSNGQLGLPTSQFTTVGIPEMIIPDGVEKIAAGNFHTMFIRYGGLYGMGFNNDGQLGIGSTSTIVEPPVEVVASGIRDVSASGNFSLFVRNDNTMLGMGDNSTGQLGQGNIIVRISPVVIENNIKDISAGNYFSVWTTQSNVVRACGANDFGQLGTGFVSGYETSPITTDSGPAYQPVAGGYQTFFLVPSLVGIQISGPTTVNELNVVPYTATANFSDSSTADVSTSAVWSIDTGGSFVLNELTTADVAGNTPATITATYSGKSDTYGITILDFATPSVTLTVDQATVSEGAGSRVITATLSTTVAQDVIVTLGYSGSATLGTDYNAGGTITIPAGNTTSTGILNTVDDIIHEDDETIIIDIVTVTNADEAGTQQQIITITDNDPVPTVALTVSTALVSESGGTSNLTVTLSASTYQDVTVDLGYTGTASIGTDFNAPASMTIPAGTTTANASFNTINDTVNEGNEAAVIDIINVISATESGTQQRTITITDDDPVPTVSLSLDQSTISELSGTASIIATLSGETTKTVTVNLSYTGAALLVDDFNAAGSITIPAGTLSGTTTLSTNDDAVYEGDETVAVDIVGVTNATENGTQQQTLIITDDELAPTVDLTVDLPSIPEFGGVATLTATLSNESTQNVTVDLGYTGSATLGIDFSTTVSVTIFAGNLSASITLNALNDTANEGDETAVIDITSVTNGTENGTQQVSVVITDDDPIPDITMTVSNAVIGESGGASNITATLSGSTFQDVTVDLDYTGTATLGADFTAPATLTIPAGTTAASATLDSLDDTLNEGNEAAVIDIINVTNAIESVAQQRTVTITDDDPIPTVTLSVDQPTINELSGIATITASLSGTTTQDVTVNLGYTGTALLVDDFNAPASITVFAGNLTGNATLAAVDDAINEGDEGAIIDIVGVINANESGTQQRTVTITDNDSVPTVDLTVDLPSISELSGVATITATLSGESVQNITVDLAYTGSAILGTDYNAPASITIFAGNLSASATINALDDTVYEGDEDVIVDITNVINGTENGTQQQTTTITDDETLPTVSLSVNASTIVESGGWTFYTLTLSGPSSQIVNVELGYTGTATFGTDYTSPVFFNIPAGTTTFTGTITASNDAVYEGNETVIADIVSVTNAVENGVQQQTVTITDDETIPTVDLAVDLPSIGELSGVATLTATLSGATTQDVTVDFGYTGTALISSDYNAPATITILAGTTSKTATITAIDDAVSEGDETVIVDVTTVANATENGVQQQTVTITDDEGTAVVSLSVDLPSVSEPTGVATLTATLSSIVGLDVTVDLGYTGTASSVSDYSGPASITIVAGNTTGTAAITITDDFMYEVDETIIVDITNVVNAIENGTQQQTVTITDNEAIPVVTLTVDQTSIGELGGSATITATLSGLTSQNVTVDFGYTGLATQGTDYTAAASMLITSGNTANIITLNTVDDTTNEGPETVIIDITNVTNALENGVQQQTVTITDDDPVPTVDLTVDLPSIGELGGGAVLTATLSGVTYQDVTVDLGYTGTAALGTDYTAPASIIILAGSTTGTATLTAIDDAVSEGDETVIVDITTVTSATENGTQQQAVTITDDEGAVVVDLTVDLTSISEVSGLATLTATLSSSSVQDITVDLGYTGLASLGTDYTALASITILAGSTSGTAALSAIDDAVYEGDETIIVDITNVINATENGTQQQTITISDDEAAPTVTLTVDLPTISEVSGIATLTATLSGTTTQDVTVDLGYTGTATSGTDYTAPATITIFAGNTTGTATIATADDATYEGNETVIADVTNVTNATESGTQQQTVTITDNETVPTVNLTVDLPSISELSGVATLTATLSGATTQNVTVDLGYTGTASLETDFTAPASITILAGSTTGTATLNTVDDTTSEGPETVVIDITNVTNALENGAQQQTVTITDDDPVPTVDLTVDLPSIGELGGGAVLSATLSGVTYQDVTVDLGYTGTAALGTDYTAPASIVILAGSTTGTATLTAIDDAVSEGDETAIVDITAVANATENGTQQQTVTITDDEGTVVVDLTVDLTSISEVSGVATLTATLSSSSVQDITVDLGYTGLASLGTDYSAPASITILAGNTSGTAAVSAIDDAVYEGVETVIVDIVNVINATENGTQQKTITISDDEAAPTVTLTVDLPTISEVSGIATLTATLSGTTTQDVTVDLGYTGTAISGTDYTAPASIIILAGNTTGTATVAAADDAIYEGDETVIVDITTVTNGTESGTQQQTVTITDDETVPTVDLTVDLPSISELSGVATLTATLSGTTTQDVTVDLGYTGTAILGTDFTAPASIIILAGNAAGTASLGTTDDIVYEGDETVIVDITNVTNATENGTQQQTVTIVDDEVPGLVTLSVDLTTINELSGAATITATLSSITELEVTVDLGYTGTAVLGTDFSAPASITIPGGSAVGTTTLTSIDDAIYEGDETVIIDITTVTNGIENGTQQQTVTIIDDEPAPTVTLTAAPITVPEASGVSSLTATLSATSGLDVIIGLGYAGTATLGTDYTVGTSITIPAGTLTGTATLTATSDAVNEGDETVVVDIITVTNGVESGTQQQIITITDDDPVPTVTLTAAPISIAEFNGTSTLTATLSGLVSQDVIVGLGYTGTATPGADYTSPASITILAGTTIGTATFSAITDAVNEGAETATIDIAAVTNATENGTQQQTITITDDDPIPTVTLTVAPATIGELAGAATLTATLSGLTTQAVTVNLGYTGTAGLGIDFSAPASITILAGASSGTATLNSLDDSTNEGDETAVVDITAVTNATESGTQQQTVTIADDDPIPTVTLTVAPATISELAGVATVTATLSNPTLQVVTIDLGYTGTAISDTDYTIPATITIPAGTSSGTATLVAIDNAIFEGDKSVIIDITNVTNGTENGTQQQTVTIADDELAPTVVSIAIAGPLSVFEESTATYSAMATWSDASTTDISTLATWTIDTGGTFTSNSLLADVVTADTPAVITATYDGQFGTLNISVVDIVVSSILIQGPGAVAESDTAVYSCIASLNDSTTADVTGSTTFTMSNSGSFAANALSTSSVSADVAATITATYDTFGNTKPVTVFNVPGALTAIQVTGPDSVDENTTGAFQCIADYSDGTSKDITDAATWSQTSQFAGIDANSGVLTTQEVVGDWPTIVTASYGGLSSSMPARILDLDPMAMIYVDKNAGGVNNGSSWTDAFKELRDAFPKAGPGTELWVAAGTYTTDSGNDRERSFRLTDSMKLYGGFAGGEVLLSDRNPTANATILSGDVGLPAMHTDNAYHVVVGAQGAIIDGFTIRDGRAYYTPRAAASATADSPTTEGTGTDRAVSYGLEERQPAFVPSHFNVNDVGAGIINDSVTLTIRNCKFINNASVYGGGAIYNQANTTVIEDCSFVSNLTEKWGGAIFNTDNATPAVIRCTFLNNRANVSGGVMMNSAGASPIVSYCQFRQNSAGRDGGVCINNFSSASFVNCVFWSNRAFNHAGAVISNDSTPQFDHCTFSGNEAGASGGAFESNNSTVSLTNSIVWGNQAMQFQAFNPRWGSTLSLSHCVIDDSSFSGTNLAFTDPSFTGMQTGVLTLDAGSSAIDTGLDIGISDDIVGALRGTTPDIGAYEYNGTPIPPGDTGGDTDNDTGGDTVAGAGRSSDGGCALGMTGPTSLLPLILLMLAMLNVRKRLKK